MNDHTVIHDLLAESYDDLVRLSKEHKDLDLQPAIKRLREGMALLHISHNLDTYEGVVRTCSRKGATSFMERIRRETLESAEARAARMWNPNPASVDEDVRLWQDVKSSR